MTSLASPPMDPSSVPDGGRRLLARQGEEWNLADWIVAVTSVGLALGSASFFSWSYVVSIRSPDYFQNAVLSRMPPKLDQIETGSVEADASSGAMPAPVIVRSPEPSASDYQIVMIFQNEALLATRDELLRVKVGSVLPGLGVIQAIDGSSLGGTVKAEKATLRSLNAPDT